MPASPPPRTGQRLTIKDRPLEFSFWPLQRTSRRYGIGARIFATDPWTIVRREIESEFPAGLRGTGTALIEQAEDYFTASESGVKAAKPLLLYYCFMNFGKAFALHRKVTNSVDNAQHGLGAKVRSPRTGNEVIDAYLNAFRSPSRRGQLQNFDLMLEALTGGKIPVRGRSYDLSKLISQVVPGHRLWVPAERKTERFISLDDIQFFVNRDTKQIWLRLFVFADHLKRVKLTHKVFLDSTRLKNKFQNVKCSSKKNDRRLLCFEQIAPHSYTGRPSDEIPALIETVKELLWQTILASRPYRKYYVYAAPSNEHLQVLPQIMSIYAITYYLGSIVRYRPQDFDHMLEGKFGPFVEAFLNDQPNQFLYLMTSEFVNKEVARAAIT